MTVQKFLNNLDALLKYKNMFHTNTVYVKSCSDLEVLMLLTQKFLRLHPERNSDSVISHYESEERLSELSLKNKSDRINTVINVYPELAPERNKLFKSLYSNNPNTQILNIVVSNNREIKNHIELNITDSQETLKSFVQNKVKDLINSLNKNQKIYFDKKIKTHLQKWDNYREIKTWKKCLYLTYVKCIVNNLKQNGEIWNNYTEHMWQRRIGIGMDPC